MSGGGNGAVCATALPLGSTGFCSQPWQLTGLLALLISAGVSRGDEHYNVLLNRPQRVGQEYTVHATGHVKQTATFALPGEPPQVHVDEFGIELDATVKVLEVDDPAGEPTKLQYTIARFLKDQQPLLPGGAVFTAENKQGNTMFIQDGAAVDPATARALEVVIETHQPGTPSNDVVFGTDQPQPVGGTWPIDAEAAAISASRSGLPVTQDQLKGEARLAAVQNVDGKPALQVEATMNVANISVPQKRVQSGSIAGTFSGLFPVDPAAMPIRSSKTITIHLSMTPDGPNGQPLDATTVVERSSELHFGPVGK